MKKLRPGHPTLSHEISMVLEAVGPGPEAVRQDFAQASVTESLLLAAIEPRA
jgi:hypothetical protein